MALSQGAAGQGVLVRAARASDVSAITRVHIESTAEAYAPLAQHWPAADFERRQADWARRIAEAEQGSAQRVELVAEVGGAVVGFCSGGPAREAAQGALVELYVIHVLPAQRGAGIGALLWSEACRQLRGPELRSMYVSTLAELRCCSFYERHGGRVLSRAPREFHGAERTRVVYFWPAGGASDSRAVRTGLAGSRRSSS